MAGTCGIEALRFAERHAATDPWTFATVDGGEETLTSAEVIERHGAEGLELLANVDELAQEAAPTDLVGLRGQKSRFQSDAHSGPVQRSALLPTGAPEQNSPCA